MEYYEDDIRREYEKMKEHFRGTSYNEFKSGSWFWEFVKWMLENYAHTVNAEYIRRKYPGISPANQARKIIKLASRYNAIAGGLSASGITALELSSLGPQAAVTVPAVASLVICDIGYCTRTQLRSTYDLSVVHRAPLSIEDADDCYLIFLLSMGVKLHELMGSFGKAVGPKIIAYNVRRLLRTGLRKTLQELLKRIGGARLAAILTERACMRLLVPGISVPISYGFNYYFTRNLLKVANKHMKRRGAVVEPIIRLYTHESALSKTIAPKVLIVIANAGDPQGWSEAQMEALRHCQSTLSVTDDDLAELDEYFDQTITDLAGELPNDFSNGVNDILDLSVAQAALANDNRFDISYGEVISKLASHIDSHISIQDIIHKIESARKQML